MVNRLSTEGVVLLEQLLAEIIDQELPLYVRSQIYPLIQNAYTLKNDFMKDPIFSESRLIGNIEQRLLSFLVERQFEDDMVSNSFPLERIVTKRNNYNFSGIELLSNNAIITIANTKSYSALPQKSGYRKEYSEGNSNIFVQQKIFEDSKKRLYVKDKPYYIIITYGGKDNVDFINLVLPESGMDGILYRRSIKEEIRLINIQQPSSPNNAIYSEKKLTSLKKEFLKQNHEEGV